MGQFPLLFKVYRKLLFLYYTTLNGISHFVLYYLDANTNEIEKAKIYREKTISLLQNIKMKER